MSLEKVKQALTKHFPPRKQFDSNGVKPLRREILKLQQQWESCFILWPRRMRNGEWIWMEDVYRRIYIDLVDSKHNMWTVRTRWEYGTIIDVLETI
jgi:hypothetical protein